MSLKNSIRTLFYNTTYRFTPGLHATLLSRRRPDAPVDPRVRYPSYKSMDGLIDVERLKAMDGDLRETVARFLRDEDTIPFYTGHLKLKPTGSRYPGSRLIQLSEPVGKVLYHDLNKPELWKRGPAADRFPQLMDFIATLPFQKTARMVIMCDTECRPVTAHRDHYAPGVLHEFIWFRTNFDKPFFVQSWQTKERKLVESYSAWFDTVNQYHGADAAADSCISIRVDGHFTEEFRARIPKPPFNKASTPSYWAALED